MINALIIDRENDIHDIIESHIIYHYPNIQIKGKVCTLTEAAQLINIIQPGIIFIEIDGPQQSRFRCIRELTVPDCEKIIISSNTHHAIQAIQNAVAGFVLKPIQNEELMIAVHNAITRIQQKVEHERNKQLVQRVLGQRIKDELIGIPCIDGLEFFNVSDIVRCEGLQKCTRIVTIERSDIISSYNLGEFKKLLEPFGFFSPHKSYLINLNKIKKYCKCGSIQMDDGVHVPIARRRKAEFLSQMVHL